jgi:hypothetical protein
MPMTVDQLGMLMMLQEDCCFFCGNKMIDEDGLLDQRLVLLYGKPADEFNKVFACRACKTREIESAGQNPTLANTSHHIVNSDRVVIDRIRPRVWKQLDEWKKDSELKQRDRERHRDE